MDFQEVAVLEILKRATGAGDGERASWGYNPPSGLQDELNLRTHKAGYTDRDGQPKKRLAEIVSMPATDKYRENYSKIDWSKK